MSVKTVVAYIGVCDLCDEIVSAAARVTEEKAHEDVRAHVNIQHSDKGGNDT